MPWQEWDGERLRTAFAARACAPAVKMRALCREYGISAKRQWADHAHGPQVMDDWRAVSNEEGPHEAGGRQPPVTRSRPSRRAFPDPLPVVEYETGERIRRVREGERVRGA